MKLFSQAVRLLSFLARWARGLPLARFKIFLILLTGMVSGISNAAFVAVINEALGGSRSTTMWIFIGLCVALPLARFLSGWLVFQLTTRAVYETRIELSQQIIRTSLRSLEILGSHRLMGAFTEDVPAITNTLAQFPTLLMQLFMVLGCCVYLAWLSPKAFLALVVFLIVGVLCYQLPTRRAMHYVTLSRKRWDTVLKAFGMVIDGAKELKLHGRRRRKFFSEAFEPAAEGLRHSSLKSQTIFLGALTWGQVSFFLVIGLLLFALPAFEATEVSVLRGYVLALLYMMNPINSILDALPGMGRAAVAIENIEQLGLSLVAETKIDLLPATTESLALADWDSLELRGASHSYHREAEDRSFTLGPLYLTIERGELLFLVGGNGSGKTTLAKLLSGLYTPEEGEIRLDGEPVTEEMREAYRQLFTVVFSDFFLFDTLLGLEVPEGDPRLQAYLEKLLLHHKVKIEAGTFSTLDLSQGQRKRLALLIAYLEDRPVYLFDEWAADQDPEFKEVFYRQLLPELKDRGKTVIVISHDDRYYDVADRLVQLEDGQLKDASSNVRRLVADVHAVDRPFPR